MKTKAYISLGSNRGNRNQFLADAVSEIELLNGVRILRKTSVLENQAILYTDQKDFLNQILEIETDFQPEDLLNHLKAIEAKLGRLKTFRFGPREIDLDILTYGKQSVSTDSLTVPHSGFYDRDYIRTLLSEFSLTPEKICPQISLPFSGVLTSKVNQLRKIFAGRTDNG
ncbi:MAG: 2-amino-4-hydroxy-6-hydroxymethyldihydropteridine diphosphokinase [Spirochaetia bacterium]|nr:2-amino-4-hydroxy-6-hydroxymethyldihydropteridine diphosphokinase [Spirochaetia bacterium]